MATEQLSLDDGKYTVEFDTNTGALRALRYGMPWRELTGDNLVYWLFAELRQAREQLAQQQANQPVSATPSAVAKQP